MTVVDVQNIIYLTPFLKNTQIDFSTQLLLLLPTRVAIELVVFCPKDIHVEQHETEDEMRVWLCPQLTASESLTLNMTQHREMRIMEATTEEARESFLRPSYMLIK